MFEKQDNQSLVGCLRHLQVSLAPGGSQPFPHPPSKLEPPSLHSFRHGDLASCLAREREAPPTGCEGPCRGGGGLTEAESPFKNDSGQLRRFVRAMEKERDVKSVFFFFIIPTLKHYQELT